MKKLILIFACLLCVAVMVSAFTKRPMVTPTLNQEVMYENHIEGTAQLAKYVVYFTSGGYTSITITYLGGSDELPIYGLVAGKLSDQQQK